MESCPEAESWQSSYGVLSPKTRIPKQVQTLRESLASPRGKPSPHWPHLSLVTPSAGNPHSPTLEPNAPLSQVALEDHSGAAHKVRYSPSTRFDRSFGSVASTSGIRMDLMAGSTWASGHSRLQVCGTGLPFGSDRDASAQPRLCEDSFTNTFCNLIPILRHQTVRRRRVRAWPSNNVFSGQRVKVHVIDESLATITRRFDWNVLEVTTISSSCSRQQQDPSRTTGRFRDQKMCPLDASHSSNLRRIANSQRRYRIRKTPYCYFV